MQTCSASPTIMVIDDSPGVCAMIAHCFKRKGYSVLCFQHPREVLHALLAVRRPTVPSLFFVDLSLPGISGFDVIRRLRTSRGLAQAPIIALSGPDRLFNPLRARAGRCQYTCTETAQKAAAR